MANTSVNLRKAAVLLQSLDAATAAAMMAQLSPAEAAALREAMRALGQVDAEEQADVAAEFRRVTPLAAESAADGVKLEFTAPYKGLEHAPPHSEQNPAAIKRFEFLERAPVATLAPYLAREHAQTIAVVLSHLRPERAAALLAAFSGRQQADVVDRLAALGDTDPESVTVVEHELAAWLEKRSRQRPTAPGRNGAAASILAAADALTRNGILANVKAHKAKLAERLTASPMVHNAPEAMKNSHRTIQQKPISTTWRAPSPPTQTLPPRPALLARPTERPMPSAAAGVPVLAPPLSIEFDQLTELSDRILAEVIRAIDPGLLVLALAGAREELIERICRQMPQRMARGFQRQLRQLGPTRLSDVEAAQRAVALAASQRLAPRRAPTAATAAK
jgi:flagellar motor switch protein FliG